MKQILITPEITGYAKEYADNLFKDKSASFVQPVDGLKNLVIDLKEINDKLVHKDRYIAYIERILKDFDKLINLLPSEFDTYKAEYDEINIDSSLSATINYRKSKLPSTKAERDKLEPSQKKFYELIVERMHYKDTRLYMGPYMKKMELNTCIYCNLAKATYSEKSKEVYYPFDHCKPKDKYPFLCISFFNLYPSCTNCNGHKLNDDGKGFQLYVEQEPIGDQFVFHIDRKKVEEGIPESVQVDFKSRQESDSEFAQKYDKCYRINEFYNSADEKRSSYQMLQLIYNHRASYPDALKASTPAISTERNIIFSEMLGIKDDENIFTDTRKKLKLDTAKDAQLIP